VTRVTLPNSLRTQRLEIMCAFSRISSYATTTGVGQFPVRPSTAHNRDLGRTALLRLAINPSKWFRKQCGVIRYQSPFGWVSGTILELGSSRMPLEGGSF
jgi:hypothetical protein